MKSLTIPVIATGAMAAAAVGLAGTANAAPSGPVTADETVRQLKADGLTVILNKFGTAPLDQCTVDAVRPGQTFTRMDSGAPGAMDDIVTTVTSSDGLRRRVLLRQVTAIRPRSCQAAVGSSSSAAVGSSSGSRYFSGWW